MKQIKYLGYIVGDGCLKIDPDMYALVSYPVPKTTRQVRRFFGMTGWYRLFISNYSSIMAPLTDLLKKGKKLVWSSAAQESFEHLKIVNASQPQSSKILISISHFLYNAMPVPLVSEVYYFKTIMMERNTLLHMFHKNSMLHNAITVLECLAAILSVKKFRAYVEGFPFTIITDHASLKWLMDQKDLSGRLARWSLKLQRFCFSIEHRKGTQKNVSDALSRVNMDEIVFDLTQMNK